eukprot:TRINITY_DN6549_c0_g1_i1.p1 TRINITY_DN6549_c0_g1~~TRINITY_DN6549_c0_g1_i1.p1  ORF type:complete len:769 (-),score=256.90 TRINITY_DN6549_c0_g1_i1:730-2697(-)
MKKKEDISKLNSDIEKEKRKLNKFLNEEEKIRKWFKNLESEEKSQKKKMILLDKKQEEKAQDKDFLRKFEKSSRPYFQHQKKLEDSMRDEDPELDFQNNNDNNNKFNEMIIENNENNKNNEGTKIHVPKAKDLRKTINLFEGTPVDDYEDKRFKKRINNWLLWKKKQKLKENGKLDLVDDEDDKNDMEDDQSDFSTEIDDYLDESESDYDENESDSDYNEEGSSKKKKKVPKKKTKTSSKPKKSSSSKNKSSTKKKLNEDEDIDIINIDEDDVDTNKNENEDEELKKYRDLDDIDEEEEEIIMDGKYKLPIRIWDHLYSYQQNCIKWLWQLHKSEIGGICGDEMGLGKTVQIICFMAGLKHSKLLDGPVLILCPATVMKQWVQEVHKWWPPFRVFLFHKQSSKKFDEKKFLEKVARENGVLITTYSGLRQNQNLILEYHWSYAILDEGHAIKNPDASITLAAKRINTHRRIVLTGAPIQNSLTELWSVFDFIFPGKLGTLPLFQKEFEVPIKLGGYSNATNVQVERAYKCSVVLRDMIKPYLLRRLKADVDIDLPEKTEQVLICKLTNSQLDLYKSFLRSKHLQSVVDGDKNLFFGIDYLRKVCNHPHLLLLKKKQVKKDPSKQTKTNKKNQSCPQNQEGCLLGRRCQRRRNRGS